jgi:DHA1 family multidrug resistance protein-like MFS transporter
MKKKKQFLLLIISWNLAASYAHPVTPTFLKGLHVPDAMFGYAFAAMSLGMFLSSPFWGKMTRVISSKTAMAIGGIGYGICQLLFALSTHSATILVARLLAGLSCGAFFVGSLTYIGNLSPKETRGRDLTLNATIQTVADAIGYFIGGWLGEISVMTSFYVQIAQLIITGILFYVLLENDVKEKASAQEIIKESNPFKAFMSAREFMNKYFVALFVMTTMVFFGYTCLDQSFNYYLKDVLHFTSKINGTYKGLCGLISLTLNMSVGMMLLKKKKLKKSNIVLLILGSIALYSLLTIGNAYLMIGTVLVFYGIYALTVPLEQNMIMALSHKENRNIVMGFYQSTKSLGMIFGAGIAGAIYAHMKTGPFVIAAGAYVTALVCALIYMKMKEKVYE